MLLVPGNIDDSDNDTFVDEHAITCILLRCSADLRRSYLSCEGIKYEVRDRDIEQVLAFSDPVNGYEIQVRNQRRRPEKQKPNHVRPSEVAEPR